jgi:hypothetical protein
MISAWLDLSVVNIFASLTVLYAATGALVAWLTFRSPLRAAIQGLGGIVAPYFASIALLFALLTGFLAGDVMDRFKQAVRAVQVEAGALSGLNALTLAAPVGAKPIRAALRAYIEALVNDEWPRMTRAESSGKAQAALTALLSTVANPGAASGARDPVHYGLVELSLQAATARSDRIAINSRQADDIKWVTVLLLSLITQLSIGMVHLDRARAHIAAVAVFAVAAVIALGTIAVQEAPFDGPLRIPPTPLERLLTAVAPEAT